MRVLVTIPSVARVGGVGNYYRVLKDVLGDDWEYVTVGSRSQHERAGETLARLWSDTVSFRRRLRANPPDLVLLNPSLVLKSLARDGLLLLAASAAQTPVAVFVRGWDWAVAERIQRWFLPVFRSVFFRASGFIVLGADFAAALRSWGYSGPIWIETTVAGDEAFECVDANTILEKSARALDSLVLLFLSRIEPGKGLSEAIDVAGALRATHSQARLVVAGDGSQLGKAEDYVAKKRFDGVHFVGQVEGAGKRAWFMDADAYILLSSAPEGMPNSVLEAMAYGLPVVVKLTGGLRDFFEDGKMGLAIDQDDPEDIARRLELLLGDSKLRYSVGVGNHEYAKRHFSTAVVGTRLKRIVQSVVESGRGERRGAPEGAPSSWLSE